MRRATSVCIDDDFAPGKPGVAMWSADLEESGRIDKILSFLIEHTGRNDFLNDMLDHVLFYFLLRYVRGMLCRYDDCMRSNGPLAFVLDGDLRFGVGPKIRHEFILFFPDVGEPLHE